MKKFLSILSVFFIVLTFCSHSFASDSELVLEILEKNLIDVLEKKGLLTGEEARTIMKKTKEDMKALIAKKKSKPQPKAEKDVDKSTSLASKTLPTWVQKMNWNGDVRMRHESTWYDLEGSDKPDRQRELFRARFGFTYDLNEMTKLGVHLITGSANPIAGNQTMSDAFSTKNISIDMAYVKHTFFNKHLTAYLGKFKVPFKPHTRIMFDPDLRLEGVALQGYTKIPYNMKLFLNVGAFPLDELKSDSTDPWLSGIQTGVSRMHKGLYSVSTALAYYYYSDAELVTTGKNSDKFGYYSGNSMDDFSLLNPSVKLSLYNLPVYVGFVGDYVVNLSEQADDSGEDTAWFVGLSVGHEKIKKFKDWKLFATYQDVEADSLYDEFTDSIFHGGGTNNKGWSVGYKFGLGKGWQHILRYNDTEESDGPSVEERRLFVDLLYKFK